MPNHPKSPVRYEILAAIRKVLPKASAAKRAAIYSALQGWHKVARTVIPATAQGGTAVVKRLVAAGAWTGQTNTILHLSTYDSATAPRNAFGMDVGKVCAHLRRTFPTCWVAVDWDAGTATPYHGVGERAARRPTRPERAPWLVEWPLK